MKKPISYKKLIINPENYRFDPVDNQDEAIDLMLEEKGQEILILGKHILENGLDKAKDCRVIGLKDGNFLVLDGNRRITAIKCLHDASIIKNKKLQSSFLALSGDKTNLVEAIQCYIYPNEKAAAKWIKLDHTGKNDGVGQDSWGSAEKDRFGYKFEGKISPAMQAVEVIEKTLDKKIDTKKLKVSTINRILSNPESRSYLGTDINKGNIVFTCDKEESIDRLSKLFSKVIDENITVDKVYHAPQAIEFMKELFGDKPKSCKKPTLPFLENKKPTEASNNTEQNNTGSLAKKDWITDAEYKNYNGSNKVKVLLKEMKLLDPKQNAHILMPVLRVLLELSLYYKLEDKGHIKKIVAKYKAVKKAENEKRIEKGNPVISLKNNWSPSFREMLNYIIDEKNKAITDPQARELLDNKIKNKEQDFVSDLNVYIHNIHEIPYKDDPERMWKKFGRPFFSIIEKII